MNDFDLPEKTTDSNIVDQEAIINNELTDREREILNDYNSDDDEVDDPKKDVKYYTPSQAQRATFKLIDSQKQLVETMKTLTPALKQSKKIMKNFKHFF